MPGPFADAWDDTTPDATALIANGQVNIRALKRAIEQRLADALNNWPDGDLSPKIRLLQITAAMMALKTITAAQIADGTLTSLNIADGGIATVDLADLLIITQKLADAAVTGAKIAAGAVSDAHISGLSGAKVADDSMSGTKLTDGSIPLVKLIGGGAIPDGAVTETKIADLAVTMAKLAVALKDKMAVPKYVEAAIPLTNLGSRATINLADIAFPGVVARDFIGCALPAEYAAASDASQVKLMMISAVAKADAITPVLRNNNDGALDWPASTVRFWVVKSASAWDASL